MEVLSFTYFSIKLFKEYEKHKYPWIYCVIKTSDQIYCSKAQQAITGQWIELMGRKDVYQLDLPHTHYLFKLQIWNYDTQSKMGETNISNNDLPLEQKQKQFTINNKQISLRFIYERKPKQPEDGKESERNSLRISYNKSDPNLNLSMKRGSIINTRKAPPRPVEQAQGYTRYDMNSFGRWKFIPVRNDMNNNKLKL